MKTFVVAVLLALAACSAENPRETYLSVSDGKGGARTLLRVAGEEPARGYEIKWRELKSREALDALYAGAVDIAGVGDTALINGRARGLPIKVITAWRITNENTAIVTRADSPVHAVGDLGGRKVCVTRGAMEHFLLLKAVEAAKLPQGAVDTAYLTPSDCRVALDSGAVAAWASAGSYTISELLRNKARILISGDSVVPGFGIIVATEKSIEEKRPAIEDFVARLRRARLWALDHPEAYAEAIAAETGTPYDIALLQVKRDSAEPVPVAGLEEPMREIQRVFVDAGVINTPIEVRAALDISFDRPNNP